MSVDKASDEGIHTSCVNVGSKQNKLSMEWKVQIRSVGTRCIDTTALFRGVERGKRSLKCQHISLVILIRLQTSLPVRSFIHF